MRLALLLWALVAATARAQEAPAIDPDAPSLRVLAMKDGLPALAPKVKLGEPFHLVITATAKADVVVGMPAAIDGGTFEVVDRQETTKPGTLEHTFELTVVAWEPGKQTFPAIPVTYVPRGQGELKLIKTAAVEVEVTAVLPSEGPKVELRPLAPPVPVFQKDWRLVIAAAAGAGLLVAWATAAFAVRALRRRKARAVAAAPVIDRRPPHEIALDKLRALGSSPLLDAEDRRPFYFAMTEVVREYLGRRFGFSGLDMTTSELLAALAVAPEATRGDVEDWLGDCDLVKFARVPASREDAVGRLARAVLVVERSTPPPPPSGPDGEAARA